MENAKKGFSAQNSSGQPEQQYFLERGGQKVLSRFYLRPFLSGMNRPSGSVAASGAAWNDSIDLYCTEHTKRHPKRRR